MSSENERQLNAVSEARRSLLWMDLNRYPLVYLPRSSTAVNEERLPSAQEMAGMELACREQSDADSALHTGSTLRLLMVILGVPALFVAGALASAHIPLSISSGLAGLCALAFLAYRVIHDPTFSLRLLVTCIVVPFGIFLSVGLRLSTVSQPAARCRHPHGSWCGGHVPLRSSTHEILSRLAAY